MQNNDWETLKSSLQTLLKEHDAIIARINMLTRKVMFAAIACSLTIVGMLALNVVAFYDPAYLWVLFATCILAILVGAVSASFLATVSERQRKLFRESDYILATAHDIVQRMKSTVPAF